VTPTAEVYIIDRHKSGYSASDSEDPVMLYVAWESRGCPVGLQCKIFRLLDIVTTISLAQ